MIYYRVIDLLGELKKIHYELLAEEDLQKILEKVKHKRYKVNNKELTMPKLTIEQITEIKDEAKK